MAIARGRCTLLASGRALGQRSYVASAQSMEHCVQQTRDLDHERYLCNLFLPPAARPAMFAVHSLNIELARVRETVSEPTIRQMRLQWWRDALDSAARGRPSANPVVEGVSAALTAHPVMRSWLERLIEMRELDLQIELQPADMGWVDAYAAGTSGSLLFCALEAVGARSDAAYEAAAHIGRAHGLVTLLRSTPHHLVQGYTYLPRALTEAHGVKPRDLFSSRRPARLELAVAELAASAKKSLADGDAIARKLPANARAAFAPAAVCGTYLSALVGAQHDVLDPGLQNLRLRLLGSLVARNVLGWR